ncbi:hypothetical protein SAMD00019534_020790, partial [Acytostelium subglobosum LB1]|uniref:hypothetical protein n=1 Tax=Acytostelium subglobosum LB1 TaxID=1410327 RepID=UPI000644B4CF
YGVLEHLFKDADNMAQWSLIPRNNAASQFPSDFALISLTTTSASASKELDMLQRNTDIVRSVFPERKILDPLKGWKMEDDLEEDDGTTYSDDESASDEQDSEVKVSFGKRSPQGRFHDVIPDLIETNVDESMYERSKQEKQRPTVGRRLQSAKLQVTDMLNAHVLWENGFTGKGTKVAVFDTGLHQDHKHFRNVKEVQDYTNEKIYNDELGHGTFVTGVIASDHEGCPGFAPDASLYIFRVFTSKKLSYTSWFLDAFNYAIHIGIDVLNLSIGGHDFMDRPFIEKVWEMSANNIIVVSAIGNDGPLYGTLSNPADQSDVIGVGSIDSSEKIAHFSSRGMTTWEIPDGYGRVKPDLVTYGSSVLGSMTPNTFASGSTECRTLSGTSVSSPVVAGAVALLLSSVPHDRRSIINPASIKQVLLESAKPIDDANIFEQGHGRLDLIEAFKAMQRYTPRVSFSPSSIDFTNCPYFWPYCTQPLYYSGLPAIVNVTIFNGMGVSGQIVAPPAWIPVKNGNLLHMEFSYQEMLWPWTGHLGVHISVKKEAAIFDGIAEGFIQVNITSPPQNSETKPRFQSLMLPVKVHIIPTPPRHKRILWDQFHNLRYPSGFLPKDTFETKDEPFDWNGDHPHTNFRGMYQMLRSRGYYLEILGSPLTCFDSQNYGALLIVDPEEEFFPAEIKKIEEDVRNKGLNLIVFADWYNGDMMEKFKFYDDNTERHWTPATGGANIPALNDFLSNFGIFLGDTVYNGDFTIGNRSSIFASGTSIIGFPRGGMFYSAELTDLNRQVLMRRTATQKVPILGFYQTLSMEHESSSSSGDVQAPGKVVVFGDSTCLDDVRNKIGQVPRDDDCFWLLDDILQVTQEGHNVHRLFPGISTLGAPLLPRYDKKDRYKYDLPVRAKEAELAKISRVVKAVAPLDTCPLHIHRMESERYTWEGFYKYENITWKDRHRVLPNVQVLVLSSDQDDSTMRSSFFFPYVMIIMVLFVLIVKWTYQKKQTKPLSLKSSTEAA